MYNELLTNRRFWLEKDTGEVNWYFETNTDFEKEYVMTAFKGKIPEYDNLDDIDAIRLVCDADFKNCEFLYGWRIHHLTTNEFISCVEKMMGNEEYIKYSKEQYLVNKRSTNDSVDIMNREEAICCDYCNGGDKIIWDGERTKVYCEHNGRLIIKDKDFRLVLNINNCPKCGRRF